MQINFFIDLTVASFLPLLWGYVGEDVMCRNPHCLAKSMNILDVNCGPAKRFLESCYESGCSGVAAHGNDVRPV